MYISFGFIAAVFFVYLVVNHFDKQRAEKLSAEFPATMAPEQQATHDEWREFAQRD